MLFSPYVCTKQTMANRELQHLQQGHPFIVAIIHSLFLFLLFVFFFCSQSIMVEASYDGGDDRCETIKKVIHDSSGHNDDRGIYFIFLFDLFLFFPFFYISTFFSLFFKLKYGFTIYLKYRFGFKMKSFTLSNLFFFIFLSHFLQTQI